jgi:hypothetical protein
MTSNYSLPPNKHNPSLIKGDVLIQVLCNKSIAQWLITDISGGSKYSLQLIDKDGVFTDKYKVVKGLAISNFIKDGLATRLLKHYQNEKRKVI